LASSPRTADGAGRHGPPGGPGVIEGGVVACRIDRRLGEAADFCDDAGEVGSVDLERALSDGPQSLKPEEFAALMDELRVLAKVCGCRTGAPRPVV
jgi:hypothetical protein